MTIAIMLEMIPANLTVASLHRRSSTCVVLSSINSPFLFRSLIDSQLLVLDKMSIYLKIFYTEGLLENTYRASSGLRYYSFLSNCLKQASFNFMNTSG